MPLRLSGKKSRRLRGLQWALVGIGLVGLWWFNPYRFFDPVQCLGKYISLGIASCGLAWILGSPQRWPKLSKPVELVLLALASALVVSFIHLAGMRQFGGFDHSALIDSGWRLLQGQRPYQDFLCSYPPAFLLGAKWAFQIGGVNWAALTHVTAVFALVTFCWCYVLLRTLRWPPLVSLLLAFSAEAATQLLASHWWFNPLVSTSAIVFLLSCLVFWERPRGAARMASLVASLVMLSLMKPNVAPLIGMALLLLATSRRHAVPLLICVVSGGVLGWGIAWWGDFDLRAMWAAYSQAAGTRGNPFTRHAFGDFGKYEQAVAWILATCLLIGLTGGVLWFFAAARDKLVPLPAGRQGAGGGANRAYRPLLLCVACVAAGLFLMQTNSDMKFSELAMIMIPVFLVVFAEQESFQPRGNSAADGGPQLARFLVMSVVLLVTIGSVVWGWQRVRIFAVGERMFFEEPACIHDGPPFFQSMEFGLRLNRVLRQMSDLLEKYPQAKVFFGPRMQFGYAVYNRPSPTQLPVVWDPGAMYPTSMEGEIVSRFKAHNFQLLVFLRHDFVHVPQGILDDIGQRYRRLRSPPYDELSVYVPRD